MCVFVSAVNRMLQPAKSPLVSQPSMCHNNPPTSRWVNPSQLCKSQRCPEKSTQGQQAKSQRSSKTVNPLTSIFVPGSTAFINRTFHQFSACLDQALTKVNAGQSFCETLAAANPYFSLTVQFVLFVLHTCGLNSSFLVACTPWWERKMWVVMMMKISPTFPVYISIMRVCDTSVGHASLHYKTGRPCTYNLLKIINSKYKFCSSD